MLDFIMMIVFVIIVLLNIVPLVGTINLAENTLADTSGMDAVFGMISIGLIFGIWFITAFSTSE